MESKRGSGLRSYGETFYFYPVHVYESIGVSECEHTYIRTCIYFVPTREQSCGRLPTNFASPFIYLRHVYTNDNTLTRNGA